MTYAYGMKNAPAVGGGLGGLPRREAGGGGSTELKSIFSAPILNQYSEFFNISGLGTKSLGFTPVDIRHVVFQFSNRSSSESAVGATFIIPEKLGTGVSRVAVVIGDSSDRAIHFWYGTDGVLNYDAPATAYDILLTATEYDVKVRGHATYTPSATTHTLPFKISKLRNTYLLGHYYRNDRNSFGSCSNFFPVYSSTEEACFIETSRAFLEDDQTFRITGTVTNNWGRFQIIEYEANT